MPIELTPDYMLEMTFDRLIGVSEELGKCKEKVWRLERTNSELEAKLFTIESECSIKDSNLRAARDTIGALQDRVETLKERLTVYEKVGPSSSELATTNEDPF